MSEKKPPLLNPTRIFLIAMMVVALGIAIASISANLSAWQQEDQPVVTAP